MADDTAFEDRLAKVFTMAEYRGRRNARERGKARDGVARRGRVRPPMGPREQRSPDPRS